MEGGCQGSKLSVFLFVLSSFCAVHLLCYSKGYVLLKVEDKSSPLIKYANPDGFLIPEKFRSAWFTSLVTTVVQDIKKEPSLAVNLKTKSHGPAIQLDISEEGTEKVCTHMQVLLIRDVSSTFRGKRYSRLTRLCCAQVSKSWRRMIELATQVWCVQSL